VKGETEPPLWRRTIPDVLAETVWRFAEREAAGFRAPGERWSWSELAQWVDRLVAGFLALGLRPGDRVGIWSSNRPEWLLTQFATARGGLLLGDAPLEVGKRGRHLGIGRIGDAPAFDLDGAHAAETGREQRIAARDHLFERHGVGFSSSSSG
jgi:hypothetical protein